MTSRIRIQAAILLISISVLLLAGCISHRYTVQLDKNAYVEYSPKGDSLDMYDERIQLPDAEPWIKGATEKTTGSKQDQLVLQYFANIKDPAEHYLAPPELKGMFSSRRLFLLLVSRTTFRAEFPGWDVTENYGNLREFVDPEVDLLLRNADSTMDEAVKETLERAEAVAMQKSTARRYMYHLEAMLEAWHRQNPQESDTAVVIDAIERFSGILKAHVMTMEGKDPLEISLEWYPELRLPMIISAYEAAGGDTAYWGHISDSIDFRWKCWLDMEDDEIQLSVIAPGMRTSTLPDTISGDTLYWKIPGTTLADSTVVIEASSYQPSLTGIFALIAVVLVYIRTRVSKSKKEA